MHPPEPSSTSTGSGREFAEPVQVIEIGNTPHGTCRQHDASKTQRPRRIASRPINGINDHPLRQKHGERPKNGPRLFPFEQHADKRKSHSRGKQNHTDFEIRGQLLPIPASAVDQRPPGTIPVTGMNGKNKKQTEAANKKAGLV